MNEPEGIVTALEAETDTPQIVEYEDVPTYDQVVNAISKIHSSLLGGVSIYANNSMIWNKLSTLRDANGRPLFIDDLTSGGVCRLFGFVVISDGYLVDDY